MILILSCPQDRHAHAMCEALDIKGAPWTFLYTPDFPNRLSLSIETTATAPILRARGEAVFEFGQCTSVWRRRPFHAKPPEDFAEPDQEIIRRECRDMRASFFRHVCPEALWVNPLACIAVEECKASHLLAAQKLGFEIPATLLTNDPSEILGFFGACRGRVVYKSFNSLVPTTEVTEEFLAEGENLRWSPGLYQSYIEKSYELRVTVVGYRVFATRIHSQQTERGKIDWREAQWAPKGAERELVFEPATLPETVEEACRRLVLNLGLAYAAIDLAVTPGGDHVFFDLNASGQFVWVDYETGTFVLDALAEMLIQGDPGFAWSASTACARVDDAFLERVGARRKLSMAAHNCELST